MTPEEQQAFDGFERERLEKGEVIDDFRGPYRWLSNFHICSIQYEELWYPSTEHAYQAAKTHVPDHRLLFTKAGLTPGQSKRLAKLFPLRPDWETVKESIMLELLRFKFTNHDDLREKLLATGQTHLVEGNTWGDVYWGVCAGHGRNRLGFLLMLVRDELRTLTTLSEGHPWPKP